VQAKKGRDVNAEVDPVASLAKARLAGQDISSALVRVADAADALFASGLTQEAIIILLKAKIGRNAKMDDIRLVLDALPELRYYCTEVPEHLTARLGNTKLRS